MRAQSLVIVLGLLLVLAACASNGTDPAESADEVASAAAAGPSTTPDSNDGERPGGPAQDPSEIDWATVDLTTIDWATMEMSEVDWQAIADNPTAANLSEEAHALIRSRTNPGNATLTIGDQVWEFDNFVCAFGHEATQSDTYSFTTNSFGEFDGVRVQMQATIADQSGQGRMEGSGTVHRINFDDISDFENPSIGWAMRTSDGLRIDANHVTAEGTFDDSLTPLEQEEIEGTFDATCGDQSRR